MEFIPAKTILGKMKHSDKWFGYDYNMNIYRGCCHGCIYCDSRSSCYRVENFDRVRAKANAVEILERELQSKKKKGVIGVGAMSDSYTPFERKYELTRQALELIAKYKFGVALTTKSDLIIRDIDVLQEINQHNNVIVQFTITSISDDVSKKIEQFVSPSSARFAAMKKISDAGIFTGVLMTPLLPFITDSEVNVVKLVRAAAANGARFIYPGMGVTLRDKQRKHYYQKLSGFAPELVEKYKKTYGDAYYCESPKAQRLFRHFREECERLGLLYKMSDIIRAYKKEVPEPNQQLCLF